MARTFQRVRRVVELKLQVVRNASEFVDSRLRPTNGAARLYEHGLSCSAARSSRWMR